MSVIYKRNSIIETFRAAVLDALDEAAYTEFGETIGATDADLPELFSTVDNHVDKLLKRLNISVYPE